MQSPRAVEAPVTGVLPWLVAAFALQRLVYHLVYLRDVPFAVATISDGRIYEQAAADLVAHPPLGAAPFYLQGLYAMQLAVPMAVGGLALALLVQLAIAGASWWVLHRAMRAMFGARTAAWGLLLALAHPPLSFYENKFLSASLTVTCCIGVVAAMAWAERRAGVWSALAVGVALGLGVLARPNLLLAAPVFAVALAWPSRASGRWWRPLVGFAVGMAITLGAMAWRNAVVTGKPTFFPAHGGGTSFYIGNNAHANGVWNAAGLFSGDVARESEEYAGADRPGDPEEVAQMGDELYRRAWQEIADDPGRWIGLLGRKAWLMLGNDELAQDFDVLGEREMIPWANRVAVPFGVLLGLAILGAAAWWRDREQRLRLFWVVGLGVATIAGNLAFFTSSQHRLPLAIPLVLLAATGVRRVGVFVRDRVALRSSRIVIGLAVLAMVQAMWPRSKQREPSAVHYYNLALAFDHVGEPTTAAAALDRALQRAPDQPLMLLERSILRRRAGDFEGAQSDLDRILATPGIPAWVRDRAILEVESVAWVRNAAAPGS
jgi:4-amino-4-deoxy-L-arabinose transferase-like glycosyltransferase